MTTRTRAEQVMYAFSQGIQYREDWDESDYIYTADGYEGYKIDAVRSTDIHHIPNLLDELK